MSYSHQESSNFSTEGLENVTLEKYICENDSEKNNHGSIDEANIDKLNVASREKINYSEDTFGASILRRVSFPKNDDELVTGYMEPASPWTSAVHSVSELLELYKKSCEKHNVSPLQIVLDHLQTLDLSISSRCTTLSLKNKILLPEDCEALEEVFKRVQYRFIDISYCCLSDIAASALFDMIEFYEAANELDISNNPDITARGWQSCISMIRRSRALQMLNARGNPISEMTAKSLGKALNTSCLTILKLEHCGLTGRPITSLCNEIRRNTSLKELWLANNDLTSEDARKIGELLLANLCIQFLDISNNMIKDSGLRSIAKALIQQSSFIPQQMECALQVRKKSTVRGYLQTEELQAINEKVKSFLNGRSMLDTLLNEVDHKNNFEVKNSDISQQFDESKHNEAMSTESSVINAKIYEPENLDPNKSMQIVLPCEEDFTDLQIVKKCDIPKDHAHVGNNNLKFHRNEALLESRDVVMKAKDLDENRNENLINHADMSCIAQNMTIEDGKITSSNDKLPSIPILNEAHEQQLTNKSSRSNRNNFHPHFDASKTNDILQNKSTEPINRSQGLQGIVLWNNSITRISGEHISDLLATTNSLEFLNIGKNVLSNDFIQKIRESLRNNQTLINLGLQSSHLTGEGVKLLSSVLQFGGNSTLQRIDIRDNNVQVSGLVALADSLKSNKSITRIDIDDVPKRLNDDEGESQFHYSRALQNVRTLCTRNFMPQESASNTKNNLYHVSRKISLTCQSLGPPLIDPKKSLKPELNVLDSKKKSSSRLRSPLPSPPIISPSSSPVPSPSRSRFQVFRVIENGKTVPSITVPKTETQSENEKSRITKNFAISPEQKSMVKEICTSITTEEGTNAGNGASTNEITVPNDEFKDNVATCNAENEVIEKEFANVSVLNTSNEPQHVIPPYNFLEKSNLIPMRNLNEETDSTNVSRNNNSDFSKANQSMKNDQLSILVQSTNEYKSAEVMENNFGPKTTCFSEANCSNTVDKFMNFIQHPVQIFTKSITNDNIAQNQISDGLKQNTGTNIFKWNRLETVVSSAPSIIHTATKQFRDIADFGRYVFKQNIALGEPENVGHIINTSEMDSSKYSRSDQKSTSHLNPYLLDVQTTCDIRNSQIMLAEELKDNCASSQNTNLNHNDRTVIGSYWENQNPSVLNPTLTAGDLTDECDSLLNLNEEDKINNSHIEKKS